MGASSAATDRKQKRKTNSANHKSKLGSLSVIAASGIGLVYSRPMPCYRAEEHA